MSSPAHTDVSTGQVSSATSQPAPRFPDELSQQNGPSQTSNQARRSLTEELRRQSTGGLNNPRLSGHTGPRRLRRSPSPASIASGESERLAPLAAASAFRSPSPAASDDGQRLARLAARQQAAYATARSLKSPVITRGGPPSRSQSPPAVATSHLGHLLDENIPMAGAPVGAKIPPREPIPPGPGLETMAQRIILRSIPPIGSSPPRSMLDEQASKTQDEQRTKGHSLQDKNRGPPPRSDSGLHGEHARSRGAQSPPLQNPRGESTPPMTPAETSRRSGLSYHTAREQSIPRGISAGDQSITRGISTRTSESVRSSPGRKYQQMFGTSLKRLLAAPEPTPFEIDGCKPCAPLYIIFLN